RKVQRERGVRKAFSCSDVWGITFGRFKDLCVGRQPAVTIEHIEWNIGIGITRLMGFWNRRSDRFSSYN
ncbi:MAG: hypothetical protein WCQ66_09035, partial [Sphaerochaetaceae bacterium]